MIVEWCAPRLIEDTTQEVAWWESGKPEEITVKKDGSGPRYEPGTPKIRSRYDNHLTATFIFCLNEMKQWNKEGHNRIKRREEEIINEASLKTVLSQHSGAKEERRYSSYSFLTSALDGVSGLRHTLAALYPWV
jgi:hypothetical protein